MKHDPPQVKTNWLTVGMMAACLAVIGYCIVSVWPELVEWYAVGFPL